MKPIFDPLLRRSNDQRTRHRFEDAVAARSAAAPLAPARHGASRDRVLHRKLSR